jgi:hypothetical protein
MFDYFFLKKLQMFDYFFLKKIWRFGACGRLAESRLRAAAETPSRCPAPSPLWGRPMETADQPAARPQ